MNSNQWKFSTQLVAVFVFTFWGSLANAFGTADDLDPNGLKAAYKVLDKDHNQKLTKAEAASDTDVANGFAAADKNHTGVLSEKEYIDYKSQIQNKNAKRVLSDSLITTKVKTAILGEKGLKTMQISVETHESIVILSGFVDTAAQVAHAAKVAKGVEGVKSVKNALVVKAQ